MTAALIIAGSVFIAMGAIAVLIAAFRESVFWGVACLLLPVVTLFFAIVHWRSAKTGFVLQLFGLSVLITGFLFGAEIDRALS